MDKAAAKPRAKRIPKSERAEYTRERILDAAEEEFAKHGFYGVTLKQVAQEVGVDTALLHYYFDDKRNLFDLVLNRRALILNEARLASMQAYEDAAGGSPTVEGALDAFIRPLIEWASKGGGWKHYFALIAQMNNSPVFGGDVMTRYFDPVIQRLIEVLRKAMPAATDEDLYWCFQLLTGSITLTLSETGRIDQLSKGACRSTDLEAVYARMVPYAAAGFRRVCQERINARKGGASA